MQIRDHLCVVALFCSFAQSSAAATWYVATNGNDGAVGTSWSTAKLTIQAGIDTATANDTVVVGDGVYATGGRAMYGAMTNRIALDKPITVRSANGPVAAVVVGTGPTNIAAVRCAYVTNGAVLCGFTLTNGATRSTGDYAREQCGGGAWCEPAGLLSNCALAGNSAYRDGGGSYRGALNNCTLSGNWAGGDGGGVCNGTLNNCVLVGNVASASGGGVYSCALSNCTLSGGAAEEGGGSCGGTLLNCTLTGNSAFDGGGGSHGGTLTDCTLTGNSAIDGGDSTPFGGGSYDGTLNNCLITGNSAPSGGGSYCGTLNNCTLIANSAVDGGGSYFGTLYNCTICGNTAYARDWTYVGMGHGGGAYCSTLDDCTLSLNGASDGGGSYEGVLKNCTLTGNVAEDPWGYSGSSIHNGGGSYGGTLINCTLANNHARRGSYSSYAGYGYGGGAYGGTLNNCVLSGNWAGDDDDHDDGLAGGAAEATLNNCTLTGNRADWVGGAYGGTMRNCVVWNNTAGNGIGANYGDAGSGLDILYSCTTPIPPGTGNIAGDPKWVDMEGGCFRLLDGSPCIDSGANRYAVGATDRDGNPRIVGGTVDMGAYECSNGVTTNGISWGWLLQYGLATDGSADLLDSDHDGMNSMQEYLAGTDPTNRNSFLGITAVSNLSPLGGAGFVIQWSSVTGKYYCLDRSTNLLASPPFNFNVASNIPATPPMNSQTDTNATGTGPYFYRIGVQ